MGFLLLAVVVREERVTEPRLTFPEVRVSLIEVVRGFTVLLLLLLLARAVSVAALVGEDCDRLPLVAGKVILVSTDTTDSVGATATPVVLQLLLVAAVSPIRGFPVPAPCSVNLFAEELRLRINFVMVFLASAAVLGGFFDVSALPRCTTLWPSRTVTDIFLPFPISADPALRWCSAMDLFIVSTLPVLLSVP